MANIKFSAFTQKVAQADVDFLVGYTGADNVRIAPSTLGDGIYLPLAGGTMTGDLEIIDNIQLQMGNGLDFRLYHDASNSVISSGTGDLYIQNTADDKDIIFKSDDGSGGITTYFYLDGGGTLTRFNEKLRGQDNVQIQVGSAGDFEMVHDGTDTKLNNYTGQLYITNESDDKDIIFRSDNGAGSFTTYFKLDGSSTDIQYFKDLVIADNVKAKFGNSSDLEIYHDASNSYIQDTGTGDLKLLGTNLRLKNGADTITFLEALSGGAVSIYHNGSKRFETTSSGVTVTGDLTVTGGDISLGGTGRIQGIDTVSAGTDAANKDYVDTAVAGSGSGTVTSVSSATTSQLTVSQSSPAPALSIVTAAVTNGGTALATGDQIYDATTARLTNYLPLTGGTMIGVTQFNDHTQHGDQVEA
ncbi:MAG: hypothetical protein GY787_08830, partial [Alteromonadales bacterium]|nr:hypothetical protein [Alteromonadales bacterium]